MKNLSPKHRKVLHGQALYKIQRSFVSFEGKQKTREFCLSLFSPEAVPMCKNVGLASHHFWLFQKVSESPLALQL